MLEQVALGQTRFVTPGVSTDQRGVVLGRYGLLLLTSLEAVVSWLRLYADEASLDEFLSGMKLLRVESELRNRAFVIKVPMQSSHTMDRVARCVRLVGGAVFTGSAKHFVKYRDDHAPYGYDAGELAVIRPEFSFVCQGEHGDQSYKIVGELAFDKLLFRLSPQRIPGQTTLSEERRKELILVVELGLDQGVVRYLWRNNVEASLALIRPIQDGAFSDAKQARQFLIFRVYDLPQRILDLFLATPGLDVFELQTANVALEVGYRHAIDLSSCASVFPDDRFFLLWGSRPRQDVLPGPLELSRIENFTNVSLQRQSFGETGPGLGALDVSRPVGVVGVDIRLAPTLAPPRHVVATLVALEQAQWLKKLVYFLPATVLRRNRVAVTDRGILLIGSEDIDVIPLGQHLVEQTPGLLVPIGMDLVPRVAPEVLSRALGHGASVYSVFPVEGPPFQVNSSALVPLERKVIARLEVSTVVVQDVSLAPPEPVMVNNDSIGRFALWGYQAPESDA